MTVPKLRFKEFEGDWKVDNFNSISKHISYGLTVRPNFIENGIPLISAREISKGFVNISKAPQISENDFLKLSDKAKPRRNDLFLSKTGSIGFTAIVETDEIFAITQNIAVIRLDNFQINSPTFFLHQMRADKFQQSAISVVNQSTIMDLQLGDIKKINLGIPVIQEQTKIASFLSTVDEKINQLNQKHRLICQYKQGMMQKLFSQQLRFKADDGSEFGEWSKSKFSEEFVFHNTNSYSRALLNGEGEIMNIHYGDIHTKFSMLFDVAKENIPFLNHEIDISKLKEDQFLKIGDLVIADASEDYKDIGKAIEVINLDHQKVVAGLHTYIARPISPFALGFCGYLMQTFKVREQIKKLATGISVLGISKTNMAKVELNLPCLEEQTKIANFLSSIDQKIEVVAQQIEQAKQWKKGLLQQMFV